MKILTFQYIGNIIHNISKYLDTMLSHGIHPVRILFAIKEGAIRGRSEGKVSSRCNGQAAKQVPPAQSWG